MNDTYFRENCREISSANVDDFIRASDSVGSELIMRQKEDVDALRTAALLYIAANMPSIGENDFAKREQQGCAFCNSGKDEQQLIDNSFEKICIDSKLKAITLENKRQFSDSSKVVSSVIRSFPIAYCPVCGRKL